MKKTLTVVLFLIGIQYVTSQSVIYRGEKSYPSTNTWVFESKSYYEKLEVTVAKNTNKTGFLMLSTGVGADWLHIRGSILLYLADGKVITLSNRAASDNADGHSIVLYSLTQAQINSLSISTIHKIRYSVGDSGPSKESYTAENIGVKNIKRISKPGEFTIDLGDNFTPYNTASEISTLFDLG